MKDDLKDILKLSEINKEIKTRIFFVEEENST